MRILSRVLIILLVVFSIMTALTFFTNLFPFNVPMPAFFFVIASILALVAFTQETRKERKHFLVGASVFFLFAISGSILFFQ
ncbi:MULTISPECIES: hypothetical protein [Bacillaceae]|uniref:DUF3953 domain-containing protein n=1 Tax=Alkalicoccobacillus plakortidis TaxID=444060 RepID=A0A9D5I238_9BACI|nr:MULTISPECIES: hypothetical protein [Bacillaceae]KQL58319.1 hypothetical protein AN965_04480 [Alkalicoccobacillus plakortidis]